MKRPKKMLIAAIGLILIAAIAAGCAFTGSIRQATPTEPTVTTDPTQNVPTEPTTVPTSPTAPSANDSTEPPPQPVKLEYPLELPLETEIVPCPANPQADDLVKTSFALETATFGYGTFSISIPSLLPISEEAAEINGKIYSSVMYLLSLNNMENASYIESITYDTGFDGTVLSVILTYKHHNSSAFNMIFTLDIRTGKALNTADMARRYLDTSYPGFITAVNDLCAKQLSDLFSGEEMDTIMLQLSRNTVLMSNYQLFIGGNGQLMLSYCNPVDYYTGLEAQAVHIPFAPEKAPSDDEAYDWLFDLQYIVDGAYATSYGCMLVDTLFYEPDTFIWHLSQRTQEEITFISRHLVSELNPVESGSCRVLLEQLKTTIDHPETTLPVIDALLAALDSAES